MGSQRDEDIRKLLKSLMDRYISARGKDSRLKILDDMVSLLKDLQTGFEVGSEIDSQFETIVRDLWEKQGIVDPNILGLFYNCNMRNRVIQIYYTKSLASNGSEAEIMAFFKGKSFIANIPQVIQNILTMGGKVGQWDYIAMFLSLNGIYDETSYLHYSQNPSKLITDIIVENLRKQSAKKEIMEFLKVMSAVDNSQEYLLAYMESLAENQEIPALKSLLMSFDLSSLNTTDDLFKVASLMEKVGMNEESLRIVDSILAEKPGFESCVELKLNILYELGRDEELIDLFLERHGILENNPGAMFSFLRASENKKNYAVSSSVIENNLEFIKKHQELMIPSVGIMVKGGKIKEATEMFQLLRQYNPPESEMLKLSLLVEKGKGNMDLFLEKSEKYMVANPGDTMFLESYIVELHQKGLYGKILAVYQNNADRELKLSPNAVRLIIDAMLNENIFEKAGQLFANLPNETIDGRFLTTVLRNVRDNKSFTAFSSSIKGKEKDIYLTILRNILYGNVLVYRNEEIVEKHLMDQEGFALLYLFGNKEYTEKYTSLENSATVREISEQYRNKNPARDWIEYNFPVIKKKIELGELSSASKLMESLKLENDPYLLYYRHILEKSQGNLQNARYSLEKAMEKLRALPFLVAYPEVNKEISPEQALVLVEEIARLGGLKEFDFSALEKVFLGNKEKGLTANLIDLLEYYGADSIFSHRLSRSIKKEDKDSEGVIQEDKIIVAFRNRTHHDILNYARDLKEANRLPELEDLIISTADSGIDVDTCIIFGDYYLSKRDFSSALYYYGKAIEQGKNKLEIPGYIESLIGDSRFHDAEELISHMSNKTPFQVILYAATDNIQEISKILKKLNLKNQEDQGALSVIVERFWSNKFLREATIEKIMAQPVLNPGTFIVEKLLADRRADVALTILRKLAKETHESPEVISLLIRTLPDMGKLDELNEYLTKFFNSRKPVHDKRKIFHEASMELEKSRKYDTILKYFMAHPSLMDTNSAGIIIFSLIQGNYFSQAETVLAKAQGNLIANDQYEKLNDLLRKSIYFDKMLQFSGAVLKRSFSEGRRLDKGEIISFTGADPIMADDVIDFLSTPPDNNLFGQSYLEDRSSEILRIINRKLGIINIERVDMPQIYYANNFKDVRFSVELFYYLRGLAKISSYNVNADTPEVKKLAIKCISDNLPDNPMAYSCLLNVGIQMAYRIYYQVRAIKQLNSGGRWTI